MQDNTDALPKIRLHPRNKNASRYDFSILCKSLPELESHIIKSKQGGDTINFSDPVAVQLLNKALLKIHYGIEHWTLPKDFLVPAIPGRADYIHHVADLLAEINNGEIPYGENVKCFDVGVGANCIYPILGTREYGWSFVGSETDDRSLKSARNIVDSNANLKGFVDCRFQKNWKDFFYGIIRKGEYYDLSICNPPFHASITEAGRKNIQKIRHLSKTRVGEPHLNFGGHKQELCYEGGESSFLWRMIHQSKKFSLHFLWYSSLVSKKSNLKNVYDTLNKVGAKEIRTIPMNQGNKESRIVAWSFRTKEDQINWAKSRWNKSKDQV